MKITDVRVRVRESDNRLRGIATITISDSFVVHDIRIIEGEKGLFVAMPSKKMASGEFKDVAHPINIETRKLIEEAIISKYNEELAREDSQEEEDDFLDA